MLLSLAWFNEQMSRMSMSAVAPITTGEPSVKAESFEDSSYSHMKNSDLYPQREKIVGEFNYALVDWDWEINLSAKWCYISMVCIEMWSCD